LSAARTETVLLSLGSNIEPEKHLSLAARQLEVSFPRPAFSRVFQTKPVGAPDSPWFLNAAALIQTDLTAQELKFDVLRPLENRLGRRRQVDRNAPRTIDLDIALFGQRIIVDRSCGVEIPDPEILTCGHVALPLADVAPDTVHPQTGQTLAQIAARFTDGEAVVVYEDLVLPAG
jgi:2-amino-4-hydroxy-6-hydroxymethyldihydropteridine diphosphokinase